MLARGLRDQRLLVWLLVAAVAISLPMFAPGLQEGARIGAMAAWMLVQGAAIAVIMAALPRVVANPMQGAGAAGLLSQIAALVTFVTPLVWQPILQARFWPGFIAVVAAGGGGSPGCCSAPRARWLSIMRAQTEGSTWVSSPTWCRAKASSSSSSTRTPAALRQPAMS